MPTPVYAQRLIDLLKQCGLDQNTIASRLSTNKSTVSQWATGQRPVGKRHVVPLLRLVEETIRFAPAGQRHDLSRLVYAWEQELYVRVGDCQQEIRRQLAVLQSPYAQQDPLRLDRRERRRLYHAAIVLARNLEFIDGLVSPEAGYTLVTGRRIDPWKGIPQPDPLAELALVAESYHITTETEEEDQREDV
jgi:transcriptional regulator with XRE-family HTH domain